MLRLISEEVAPVTRCKYDFQAEGGGGGGEVVVNQTLLGARCRHRKVVQNLYTTTWQSNIVGPFTSRETRDPGRRGWWAVPRVGYFFYLKWRWALNQEITGSAAQQGGAHARRPAKLVHSPFVLDWRMCYCWNRGWKARRPDLAGKFARMGAWRLGGLRAFSTGIPSSSYFLAASNGGLEA